MAEIPTNSPENAPPAREIPRVPAQFADQLSEEYTIDTPENVSFGYEVAGIGSRFIATLIDSAIIAALLFGLNIAIVVLLASLAGDGSTITVDSGLEPSDSDWASYVVIAIYALLNFAIWWGYYLLFEWLWHGQTIGKRAAHIRVVRTDGAPVGFVPVAVRNLVRIIDFLPTGYAVGVVTMFCNSQSRRLGDFAAGTLVVKDQGELTLASLMASLPSSAAPKLRTELPTMPPPATQIAPATPSPAASSSVTPATVTPATGPELSPNQDWSGIRRLSAADYELVQETLARYGSNAIDRALLARVATAIATKMAPTASSQGEGQTAGQAIGEVAGMPLKMVYDQVTFLRAVAAAYGRWVR